MKELIHQERLNQLFMDLSSIDSISYQERKAADYVKAFLSELGAEVYEDDTYKEYFKIVKNDSGEEIAQSLQDESIVMDPNLLSGNVFAYIDGDLPGKPLLFSAHLDTVSPGIGKVPIINSDKFVSKSDTVLGSDDMAGVAQILEAVRLLKENNIKHRSLELVFPFAEEVYGQGCRAFDYSKLSAEEGYVLDLNGSIGTAALQAPTIISFRVEIKGCSAHAGFASEKGIHSIKIASSAIQSLKLGRIDNNSTRNIGTIIGGDGRNIIPEIVVLEGEIRSYDHQQALKLLEETKKIFNETAEESGATLNFYSQVEIKAYKIDKNANVVKRFYKACNDLNIKIDTISTFGGSDNNHFVDNGIHGIVLSCGMQNVHTKDEYILLDDLYLGTTLVLNLATDAN